MSNSRITRNGHHPKNGAAKPAPTNDRAHMNQLAYIVADLDRLARRVELLHFASMGYARAASSLNVSAEEMEQFLQPLTDAVGSLYEDARAAADELMCVCVAPRDEEEPA